MLNGEHLTAAGKEQIASLKSSMNAGRTTYT